MKKMINRLWISTQLIEYSFQVPTYNLGAAAGGRRIAKQSGRDLALFHILSVKSHILFHMHVAHV